MIIFKIYFLASLPRLLYTPTPGPSVHMKSRGSPLPVTARSWRSYRKIGNVWTVYCMRNPQLGRCGYLLFFRRSVQDFLHILVLAPGQKKKTNYNSLWNYIEEETYAACHIHVRLHFKHQLNLMLVTELQNCQNNIIAKQVFFCISKVDLLLGKLPLLADI